MLSVIIGTTLNHTVWNVNDGATKFYHGRIYIVGEQDLDSGESVGLKALAAYRGSKAMVEGSLTVKPIGSFGFTTEDEAIAATKAVAMSHLPGVIVTSKETPDE